MPSFTTKLKTPIFIGLVQLGQGNPMEKPVELDDKVKPNPKWSNTTPATGKITPSGDGHAITYDPLAVGSDKVDVSVVIGGKTITKSGTVTVEPDPPEQTFDTIELVELSKI